MNSNRSTFLILSVFLFFSCSPRAQVIFEDNFEGNSLNMDHWNYEEGDGCPNLCGWGNNERQIYSRDYIKVEDGKLVIEAVKEGDKYFSGKINSRDKIEFQYGTIEVRLKLPRGHGIWPAVWMLGTNINEVGWPASGEIDIMEYVGREPHTIYSSLHTPANHGDNASSQKTFIEDIEEGYHTYKTIWSENDIQYFIDGEHVYTFTPPEYNEAHYPFRHPFYFLINMAVGGNFGGPEVDDSIFPVKFYVDWIKVTRN
ncbi:MAG TPA: glycoside hydrolase family 16 protein [Gillisia sp.]|nr:glycoside hydrolase family 16 protein [Gillisia sp.]